MGVKEFNKEVVIMLNKKELKQFGFELVKEKSDQFKDMYEKHTDLVKAYLENYETTGDIHVVLTDDHKIRNYIFDYPDRHVDDTDLEKMFEYVSEYLIPYFINETEENLVKMANAKETLLKNVEFPSASKEWERVTSNEQLMELMLPNIFSPTCYEKDFDDVIASVSICFDRLYIDIENKTDSEFIALSIKLNDEIINREYNKLAEKILKVIDDTVVPYYRNGVRDSYKMIAAFNAVDVVD